MERSDGETLGRQSVRLVMGDERRRTLGTTGIVSTSEGAIGRAASQGTGHQRIPREGVPETAGKQRSALPVLAREQLFEQDRRRSVREPRSSTQGRGKRAL